LPDTARPPAVVTRAVPLPCRRRYSTEREGEAEKTTSRIPSRDKFAHDNEQGLAIVSKGNHAERWTYGAPTPEGQVPTAEVHSAPGRFGPLTSCSSNIGPA
jgi:hypothetical protein